MKKFLSVLVIVGVAASLTGCGKGHRAEAKRMDAAQKAETAKQEAAKKEADRLAAEKKQREQADAQEFNEPRAIKLAGSPAYLHLTQGERNSVKPASDASNASVASEAPSQNEADLDLLEQTRADGVCKQLGMGYAVEGGFKTKEIVAETASKLVLAIVNDDNQAVAQEITVAKGDIVSFFSSVKCLK